MTSQYSIDARRANNSKKWLFPLIFVSIYGSGFVGAKLGLPDANPLSFLSYRFMIAGLILLFVAYLLKIELPKAKDFFHISIAGSLTVAVFSIGVFESINLGLSPAISALIIALQPILVSIFARKMVNETLSLSQWVGLGLGLAGVLIVVSNNIDTSTTSSFSIFFSFLALIGLTFGNLYQKKYCSNMNVFIGGSIQSLISFLICIPLMMIFEGYRVEWTTSYIIALSYMSIGVSIGALTILYLMIREGNVSKVASVFYLVPVSAAFSGYLLFGETFEYSTLIGASIVLMGVLLTNYEGEK
ncbi:DMT family transporter [Marinomonas primoryensis]|jgi:drug/metabolite transporter (DMT)-like permease|uniref:DMT family transporter n=1 Tax=Marinomonas primoryensis TaxID=178399 RepID=UPI0030DAB178|tara:strand:+ start:50058 stop:50960 length:903 start_codon:yes stop_codon:yes gene_type:complete